MTPEDAAHAAADREELQLPNWTPRAVYVRAFLAGVQWLQPKLDDAERRARASGEKHVRMAAKLTALRDALDELPRYKVSEVDDMLPPTPQEDGVWIHESDVEAARTKSVRDGERPSNAPDRRTASTAREESKD